MKTLTYLTIIIIGIVGSYGIFTIMTNPYIYSKTESNTQVSNTDNPAFDFSNAVQDNPLGIKAKIVNEVDRFILCPSKCDIPPTPHLVLSSQFGAWFVSYEICDGVSCKKDVINAPYVHLSNSSTGYNGMMGKELMPINLQNLPWKVGDMVYIKIKACPAEFTTMGDVITHIEKTTTVDLGESQITTSES